MAFYSYTPSGVCSRQIVFELEDGKLSNIKFTGGCPGNLAAISKLLDGADALETVKDLPTVTGMTTINATHDAEKDMGIVEIRDGKKTFIGIVKPEV